MVKPRTAYPDNTRGERAQRRKAILDAAAARMGWNSWSAFETAIRAAMENAITDNGAASRLRVALIDSVDAIKDGPDYLQPADVAKIYEQYPVRRAGRKKSTPEQRP